MKIRKIILLIASLTVLAIIATSVYASEPSEPHDADAIWIEPSTIDITGVSVGYKFNVTVWANASKETAGWQILLYYERAYLNITRVGYTAGSKSEFFQDISVIAAGPVLPYDENSTHSSLLYGEAWMGGPYRSPGYGSLCWIEFEVIAQPPEGVNIPLDIRWASIVNPSEPDTFLYGSDESKFPTADGIFNAVVIPELGLLAMLALLAFATPTVLYAYKKKR